VVFDAWMTGTAALALLVFAAAVLYSSVGHGGGSGYLAAMALVGVSAAVMKPTALALNVLVATIASIQFLRAGCFSWPVFWPFALGSVPLAFVGGGLGVPEPLYHRLVGVVLLCVAGRLATDATGATTEPRRPPRTVACVAGALIGFVSGAVGIGGGIFLSPLLLFRGWAESRTAASVSAVFILVNSVAGITGHLTALAALPADTPVLVLAAFAGGLVGSTAGARTFATATLHRVLSAVLVVAGLKLLLLR
jgi:uncharacterized membrane protein YfcA